MVSFFKKFLKINREIQHERISAVVKEAHTPESPQSFPKRKARGIRKKSCLNKVITREEIPLPTDCKKQQKIKQTLPRTKLMLIIFRHTVPIDKASCETLKRESIFSGKIQKIRVPTKFIPAHIIREYFRASKSLFLFPAP